MNRRSFYRLGSVTLGSATGLMLAIPGVRFLLDPLNKRSRASELRAIARLSELTVGVPRAFPVLDEREDAWVRYPKQPVGSVWLIRQSDDKVLALTAECPHLGCAIGMNSEGNGFLCPCHQAKFRLDGGSQNGVAPRSMDKLDVELTADADPEVRVKFERFQTQTKERKPLV